MDSEGPDQPASSWSDRGVRYLVSAEHVDEWRRPVSEFKASLADFDF